MARRKLSERQKARIAKIQEERRRRVAARAESALDNTDKEDSRHGQVVTRHGQHLVVADGQQNLWHCLLRQNLGDVVCGDRVVWQPTGESEGVVIALLQRDSVLSRPDYSGRDKPIAANISQLVIVLAPQPEPVGYLIDQYTVAAELIGVKALITLNKADLMDEAQQADFRQRFALYADIGYPLIHLNYLPKLFFVHLQGISTAFFIVFSLFSILAHSCSPVKTTPVISMAPRENTSASARGMLISGLCSI